LESDRASSVQQVLTSATGGISAAFDLAFAPLEELPGLEPGGAQPVPGYYVIQAIIVNAPDIAGC